MKYINGICFTNLDNIECNLTKFVAVPVRGDYIKCKKLLGGEIFLRVCSITHCIDLRGEPYIKVELNK